VKHWEVEMIIYKVLFWIIVAEAAYILWWLI